MNNRSFSGRSVLCVMSLSLAFTPSTKTRILAGSASAQKGAGVMARATGTFEVKLTPQAAEANHDPSLGRMTIEKQFHGDLEGTSKGQMLTAGTDTKGSGVYVAVERFTGKLSGRSGSFSLHHTGIMTRGEPHLGITIVPDSGTGDLAGIAGTMKIIIGEGKHSYEFDYTITPAP